MQAREVLLNEDKRRAYDAEVRAAASGACADGDGAGASARRASSAGAAGRSPEEEFRV